MSVQPESEAQLIPILINCRPYFEMKAKFNQQMEVEYNIILRFVFVEK